MKTIIKTILLIVLIALSHTIAVSQKRDTNTTTELTPQTVITEGTVLAWNLSQFESLYGIPDSVINDYRDTLQAYLNDKKYEKEIKEFIEDYKFLEQNELLYAPCRIVIVNKNERFRVFFTEIDSKRIRESGRGTTKMDKLETYLKMNLRFIEGNTYFCEELIEVSQKPIDED